MLRVDQLTLFDLFDRPDHVVKEVLQITERVCYTCSFVYLCQGRVEDGNDVL